MVQLKTRRSFQRNEQPHFSSLITEVTSRVPSTIPPPSKEYSEGDTPNWAKEELCK